MIDNELKKFIEDNTDLIENNRWDVLYNQFVNSNMSGHLTSTFLNAGINPLSHLNYIPNHYLYHTNIKGFKIPHNIKYIGSYAFALCHNLMTIDIPYGITRIGNDAFYGCYNLTNISIPHSMIDIGSGAFAGCVDLRRIIIPNGVRSIGYSAFFNCSSLTSITIPDSVTRIGDWAFYNCLKLEKIKFNGTIKEWKALTKKVILCTSVPAKVVNCLDGDVKIIQKAK